jgi:hypothetical protein
VNGKIEVYGHTTQTYMNQDLTECANALTEIADQYKKPEKFATSIKRGMIAPFSYVLKQMKTHRDQCVPYRYGHGISFTGKTTDSELELELWRKNDKSHIIGWSEADSMAKMGDVISKTTFTVVVDEAGDLNDPQYREYKKIVNALKYSAYNMIFRSRQERSRGSGFDSHPFPALSALYFTSNYEPPQDTAFCTRILSSFYTPDEFKTDDEKKAYRTLFDKHRNKIGTLGDFTANYILNNNECLKTDWKQLVVEILTAFYKKADVQLPTWVNLLSNEDRLGDVIEIQKQTLRSFLKTEIDNAHSKHYNSMKESTSDGNNHYSYKQNITFKERFDFCLDKDVISYLKKIDAGDKVAILHDIIMKMRGQRIDYFSNLEEIKASIGGGSKDKKLWIRGSEGKDKRKQHRVITVNSDEFLMFIDPLGYIQESLSPEKEELPSFLST